MPLKLDAYLSRCEGVGEQAGRTVICAWRERCARHVALSHEAPASGQRFKMHACRIGQTDQFIAQPGSRA